MRYLPKINAAYWPCLILASLFGTNLGGLLGQSLGLGHLKGLPLVAGGLALVFLAERILKYRSTLVFWAAVALIVAAASNLADAFHDFQIRLVSVPVACLVLAVMVIAWRLRQPSTEERGFIPVNGYYWLTLGVAAVLGAAAGDAAAYPLGFGYAGAVIAAALPLAFLLAIGRNGLYTDLGFYWLALVFTVATGTTASSLLSHALGNIGLGAALSGFAFLAAVAAIYELRRGNRSLRVQTTGWG